MSEQKTERLQLLMEPSLRRKVRAWRFSNEIESEGEAIRRLIEKGLEAAERDSKEGQ